MSPFDVIFRTASLPFRTTMPEMLIDASEVTSAASASAPSAVAPAGASGIAGASAGSSVAGPPERILIAPPALPRPLPPDARPPSTVSMGVVSSVHTLFVIPVPPVLPVPVVPPCPVADPSPP